MLAAIAVLLAGCSFLPRREFAYTFPKQALGGVSLAALPVVLTDQTGGVIALNEAPNGFSLPTDQGMQIDPADPNAIVVQWVGEPCDTRVRIDVTETSGNVDIVVTRLFRAAPCEAIGIVRAVRITLSRPADAARIGVRFTPQPEDANT